jgi:hypothetical protein
MTLRKSRFVLFAFAFAAFALALAAIGAAASLVVACSGQGEGERCSLQADNNGNDDCAGDLVCTAAGSLNGSSTDRCCPQNRAQSTTPVCATQTATGIDAGAPIDSGSTDAGTDGGDASKDSPSGETGSDGGSDAPADG